MLTVTIMDNDMNVLFVVSSNVNIDTTDGRNRLLLAKSIVETIDNVAITIETVTSDVMDMMIEITEPEVKERKPMFYSDN